MTGPPVGDLLRELAPQVTGVLVRRHGRFDECEDAVQEALLAAALRWPADGVPDRPRSWLLTVAERSLVDQWRSDSARRRRELAVAALAPVDAQPVDGDDTLVLLFLCCHPALSPPSQLALTLRAVGGLTTAEIAAAFLVPESAMTRRISRAKQAVRRARFELPPASERAQRLHVVLHVLYLIFNEGYTTSSGPELHRADLTAEAIRLTRLLRRLLPDEGEVAGLLALMLLTDARRVARTDADGSIVPLADQRRDLWDAAAIAEGLALVARTLGAGPIGPYQVQAAIAAVHDEAPAAEDTDWPQVLALYEVLDRVAPGPIVTLGKAVAVAMVHGPKAGLALLGTLDADDRMTHTHRLDAVRAHLLEQAGETAAAREAYLRAATMTASAPEQRYLALRAARLPPREGWNESAARAGVANRGKEDDMTNQQGTPKPGPPRGKNTGGGIRTGEDTSKSLKYSQEVKSPGDEPERPGRSLATTSHEVIQQWAAARDATPATVEGTEHGDHLGVLRFDFPGYGGDTLRKVGWDEWFKTFDERRLNFIYQEERSDGTQSNFFRLENPDREDA
jgi:predicted RNA polymerase sigma factor